jgi:hypothetical protein
MLPGAAIVKAPRARETLDRPGEIPPLLCASTALPAISKHCRMQGQPHMTHPALQMSDWLFFIPAILAWLEVFEGSSLPSPPHLIAWRTLITSGKMQRRHALG